MRERLHHGGLPPPLSQATRTWLQFSQGFAERIFPLGSVVSLQRMPNSLHPLVSVLVVGRLEEHGSLLRVQSEDERLFLLHPFRLDGHNVAQKYPSLGLQPLRGALLAPEVAEALPVEDEVLPRPAFDHASFLAQEAFFDDEVHSRTARLSWPILLRTRHFSVSDSSDPLTVLASRGVCTIYFVRRLPSPPRHVYYVHSDP